MNKTYIAPSIKWLSVDADASLLAASEIPVESDSVAPEEAQSKENVGFGSSHNIWDE